MCRRVRCPLALGRVGARWRHVGAGDGSGVLKGSGVGVEVAVTPFETQFVSGHNEETEEGEGGLDRAEGH